MLARLRVWHWPLETCHTWNSIAPSPDWPCGIVDTTCGNLLLRQYIPSVNNFGNFMPMPRPFRLPKLRMEETILCE